MIVGLVGYKRSGKDTLCRIIQKRYPQALRVSVADPIKEDLARRFETTVEAIEADKEHWRPVLQWWGETRREFWTSKAFLKIHNADSNLIVVTDARYPEQFDLIRARGGLIVRIIRTVGPADTHPSEMNVLLSNPDVFIENPGDERFEQNAEALWPLIDRGLGT